MQRLPETAVFSGSTAAWLHGFDTTLCAQIEITIPKTAHISRLAGLCVRRCDLRPAEVSMRRGFRVTSAVRTVADLARGQSMVEAVTTLDGAMHRGLVTVQQMQAWAESHSGYRGVAGLRRAIDSAEPATESPMETRLRMLLLLAGLPRPKVQVTLRDDSGMFLARPDLYFPGHRLVIEYDGAVHRNSLVADDRRQNRLIDAGYRVIRFTAADLLDDPVEAASLVRRALCEANPSPIIQRDERAFSR
ncbi:MAG TPA: DUF559 domain-containing protein [Candidatus Dormibacteraeota bacterium]|nr:DUF559 domain-containing protein [Candidatus Dormibacteraeota bacterium]